MWAQDSTVRPPFSHSQMYLWKTGPNSTSCLSLRTAVWSVILGGRLEGRCHRCWSCCGSRSSGVRSIFSLGKLGKNGNLCFPTISYDFVLQDPVPKAQIMRFGLFLPFKQTIYKLLSDESLFMCEALRMHFAFTWSKKILAIYRK